VTEILRPGFASVETPVDRDADPVVDRRAELEHSHYGGASDETAVEKTWAKETLCTKCLCAPVCVVFAGAQAPRVVVSRCLAHLPVVG